MPLKQNGGTFFRGFQGDIDQAAHENEYGTKPPKDQSVLRNIRAHCIEKKIRNG